MDVTGGIGKKRGGTGGKGRERDVMGSNMSIEYSWRQREVKGAYGTQVGGEGRLKDITG